MPNVVAKIPIGARYMILSALAFSVMGLFVKAAGAKGIPVLEIVTARSLVSLVLSYLAVKHLGIPLFGNRKPLLFARGIVGFISLTLVYYALTRLPFAEATVLQYLHPMFTAILAVFILHERVSQVTLICIIFSFLGLILIVRPSFMFADLAAGYDPIAVMAAVAGAFGSACAYVLVRKLNETEHPLVIVFYFPLISLPASLPFLWHDFVMPQGFTWLMLLAVGVSTQVGQVALTKGMQSETASRATSFSYLQVVFAILIGVIFFAEIPSFWTIMGALMIVVGAYVNVIFKH